ncbi:MAG: DoxX family protein [Marinoscillum sp.]|uniref:DoxX family protein n=1 Tax=Marinoscillum sp. TaxID=2024838 RepID=UPI0033021526
MKSLGFIGKLLYALPFAMFGFFHFMNASGMAGMVPSVFPAPEAWVYLTGLGHILAVVAIVIDKKAKLATMLLGIMLLSFALLIHFSGFMDGDQMATGNFLKDTSLAGAAFFMSSKLTN